MAAGWRKYPYDYTAFGQRVREYRGCVGWSLSQLASASGINVGTLWHLETNGRPQPPENRAKLVHVLADALEEAGWESNPAGFLDLAGLHQQPQHLPSSKRAEADQPQSTTPTGRLSRGQAGGVEDALLTERREAWREAAGKWVFEAQLAEHQADWNRWARCEVHVAQNMIHLGRLDTAVHHFDRVLTFSRYPLVPLTIAEAYIRRGWAYYEQSRLHEAVGSIWQGLRKVAAMLGRDVNEFLNLIDADCRFLCASEGYAEIVMLAVHFLGRCYTDSGIEQDNEHAVRRGLVMLQRSYSIRRDCLSGVDLGFEALRQVLPWWYLGDTAAAERCLQESADQLPPVGPRPGHIALQKGRIAAFDQPGRARAQFERARHGFAEPAFYGVGVSRALRERAALELQERTHPAGESAMAYALVSSVLHAYPENLDVLAEAARRVYWAFDNQSRKFTAYWGRLEEQLWAMDTEPFTELRRLVLLYEPGQGAFEHVQKGLRRAERIIQGETGS